MGLSNVNVNNAISIHALQTECDALAAGMDLKRVNFYPRTPNGVRP